MLALYGSGDVFLVPAAAPDTARRISVYRHFDTLSFSPDGKTVAVSNHHTLALATPANENAKEAPSTRPLNANTAEVRLLEVANGRELWRERELTAAILSICFLDGNVVLGCADGRILVYAAGTGIRKQVIEAHTDWIYALAAIPEAKQFLSSGRDGVVKLWSLDQEKPVAELKVREPVTTLAVAPDGSTFAGSDRTGSVHLFDLKKMAVRATLPGHPKQRVHLVAYGPEKNQLITSAADTVKIWDLEKGEVHRTVPTSEGFKPNETYRVISGAAYSPATRQLVTGQPVVDVRAWNLGEPASKPVTIQRSRNINRSFVDPNLAWIVYVGSREVIRKDITTLKETVLYEVPAAGNEFITDSHLSTDGRRLTFRRMTDWRAIEMPSGIPVELPGHDIVRKWGARAKIAPDGKSVWHFYDRPNQQSDPTVLIQTDLATGKELIRFEVQSVHPAMSDPWSFLDNGKRFVGAQWGGELRIHEYPSGREVDRLDPGVKKPGRVNFIVSMGTNHLIIVTDTRASDAPFAAVLGYDFGYWDLTTKKKIWSAPFAAPGAYSRGGGRVLLGSKLGNEKEAEAEVTAFEIATGEKVRQWKFRQLPVSAKLDSKGETAAFILPPVDGKEKLILAEVTTGKTIRELDRVIPKERVHRWLIPQTRLLILATPIDTGTRVEVIDFEHDKVIGTLSVRGDLDPQSTFASPDGMRMTIQPLQRVVPKLPSSMSPELTEIWELNPLKKVLSINGRVGWMSPDGTKVIAREDVGEVCRDIKSGALLYRVDQYFRGFSADGKHFETYVFDNTGFTRWGLYDVQTGAPVARISERDFFSGHHGDWMNFPRRMAIAPDNGELYTVGGDATVRVWNPQTGKQLRKHSEAVPYLTAITFLPDGKHFLTAEGSAGSVVRLWDRTTGQSVHHFRGGDGYRAELGLSADGKTVFAATPSAAYFWMMPEAHIPAKR